jgi:prophage antirepressor-like protein
MDKILTFEFGEQPVRIVEKNNQPWFVAADVCRVLEIANTSDAIAEMDDDERDDIGITDAIGRLQQTKILSESGLYALIFKSRKPEAKRFRKWVTAEVLPTLRRTGSYRLTPNNESGITRMQRILEETIQGVRDNTCPLPKANAIAYLAGQYLRSQLFTSTVGHPALAQAEATVV